MANMPIFATGKYENIQPAIDQKILRYPAWVFIDGEEGDAYRNRFAFIDKESNIRLIEGGETDFQALQNAVSELSENVLRCEEAISALQESKVNFVELDSSTTTALVSDAETMESALDDDTIQNIILVDDITYNKNRGIVLNSGAEKNIDLAGHTITMADDNIDDTVYAVYVSNGSTLSLTDSVGTGTIDAGNTADYHVSVAVFDGTTLNVYGGNYTCGAILEGTGGSTTVYSANGTINIYDGYFENTSWDGDNTVESINSVLNIKDGSGSHIVCFGGKFLDQDPANGDDADTATGETFLADGYESVPTTFDGTHILYVVTKE